ncbi:hypothetical protein KA517_02525 [Candidatus Gracilibacteria bacterium]|nr:hypothetical protein [Candidatus Gracilibacteria bacterium]
MDTLPSQPVSSQSTTASEMPAAPLSSTLSSQKDTLASFPDASGAHEQSGSLIRALPVKHRPAYFLWLLTLIALGSSGYSIYLAMNQAQAMTAYQQSLTQWSGQVTALQSSLAELTAKVATLPTVLPTPVPTVPTVLPTESSLPFGLPSSFVSPSSLPTGSDTMDDSIGLPNSSSMDDAAISTTPSVSSDAPASGGRLTAEDETAMLNSYLADIVAGAKPVSQPDGLALVKNRQSTADGMINYDVFKSKSADELYIYARKSSQNTGTFADGWYGPFAAFPGA